MSHLKRCRVQFTPDLLPTDILAMEILEHGCVLVACRDCGHSQLVAFSCKRRGYAEWRNMLRDSTVAVLLQRVGGARALRQLRIVV
jgi:hypothetical protein